MNSKSMMSRKKKIFLHLLGSIFFLSTPVLFAPANTDYSDLWMVKPFRADLFRFAILLIFFYIHHWWMMDSLYFKKKYFVYFLILLLFYLLILTLPSFVIGPEFDKFPRNNGSHFKSNPFHEIVFSSGRHFFLYLMVTTFSMMLKMNERWKKTEKERLKAELSNLKNQINPHFLFNTLNSIYSLSMEKSDLAPTAVVKLSGMMRYMLTDAKNDWVSLEKELENISNYIDLQKIRLGNTVLVEYVVEGDVFSHQIAPLLLIPFIENAFKYGVNPEEDSKINIHLQIIGNTLKMMVFNKKVNREIPDSEKSGLGLINTSYRLQLFYPNRHQFHIRESDNDFTVNLSIDLV